MPKGWAHPVMLATPATRAIKIENGSNTEQWHSFKK